MSDATQAMDQVESALRGHRFSWASEEDLQRGVELVLLAGGIRAEREHQLGRAGRVDFFVPIEAERGIAIELKTQGGLGEVLRQLHRYAECPIVAGVVLVTTSLRHCVPAELLGKPARRVCLGRLG